MGLRCAPCKTTQTWGDVWISLLGTVYAFMFYNKARILKGSFQKQNRVTIRSNRNKVQKLRSSPCDPYKRE